jgi:hypothetical protein
VPITDLLDYDVRNHHDKNRILGDKVAQVLQQNMHLADEISEAYQTPSEKLKKDPIMALVTKTVATSYIFIKHNNGGKRDPGTEDFSSWENHFSKRRSDSESSRTESKEKMNKVESESKSESKIESRNESKGKTNKVKAINNSKTEIRIKLEGRQDKVRKVQMLKDSILKFSFHRHLTATFTISIFIFNFIILDHFDHHSMYPFRRFTLEDLKD